MIKINLKKFFSSISILAISVPSTLMVVACGNKQVDISQKIINAINENIYTKQVNIDINNEVEYLKLKMPGEFFKKQLDENLKSAFDLEKFNFNTIFNENNQELTNEDLSVVGTINAKINYNYDKFKNQNTKLTINVSDKKFYQLNNGEVSALVHSSNGNLYAGTNIGGIWKVNLTDEENYEKLPIKIKNTNQELKERINFLVEGLNGKLYAGTISNKVWEIDLETNLATLKQITNGDGREVITLIQATNGKLYAGTGIGNVFEMDLETSAIKKYRFEDWGNVNALFEAKDGKIYAATAEGRIWAIDLELKKHNNVFDFKNKTNSIFDMKQVNDNEFIFVTKDKVYQYNLDDKKITERFTLDDPKDSFLLIDGKEEEFFVVTRNGKMYEVNLINNKINNKIDLNNDLASSLLVTSTNIYVGTKTGIRNLVI